MLVSEIADRPELRGFPPCSTRIGIAGTGSARFSAVIELGTGGRWLLQRDEDSARIGPFSCDGFQWREGHRCANGDGVLCMINEHAVIAGQAVLDFVQDQALTGYDLGGGKNLLLHAGRDDDGIHFSAIHRAHR